MKIAIISDIHGNMPRLLSAKKTIKEEKINTVICCGDIQTEESLEELDSWKTKTYLAFGNADYALAQKYEDGELTLKNIKLFEKTGQVVIKGNKIAFCHYDSEARNLARNGGYDIVFYGHTHTPWEETIGDTRIINPGELSGQFGRASFAIFDTDTMKAQLVIVE
jgi:putative phosphoesterase